MSLLQEKKDHVYLEFVQNIYNKNKELYAKSKEIVSATKKTKELISELEKQLSSCKRTNEKNNLSEKHLETAKRRLMEYKDYLITINEAISSTAQDFLNVKGDLILSRSAQNFEKIDNTLTSLKSKSNTMNYILNNIPYYD